MREKAKQLVTLLKDEEKLREERIHALKTKEKMAQTTSGEMSTFNVEKNKDFMRHSPQPCLFYPFGVKYAFYPSI